MLTFNRFLFIAAIMVLCAAVFSAKANTAKLNDAQIVDIAFTANSIDIKAANQALEKTHNPKVKAFADEMVKNHIAMNEQLSVLLERLNVTPGNNDTSKSMIKQGDAERDKLSKLDEDAFDKKYIENEVTYHHVFSIALKQTLIPSSGNQELRGELIACLQKFREYEIDARHLASGLP